NFHRALSNHVAAEDTACLAIDDQFAEAGRPPIDDRASGGVEVYFHDQSLVGSAGSRLGQADLRVFGIGEAPDRAHCTLTCLVRARHRVSRRDKSVLYS